MLVPGQFTVKSLASHSALFSRGVLDSFLFQLSIVGSNAFERAMDSGVIPRDEALEAILVVPADKGIPCCPEPTR